ncbi:hypothetical protein DAPPUDRAFT_337458 [Daphnia pulex]|uniref:DDT domain-containing protein n=1 Tax=Daphnia pulex TaxID=6669 RepID=E9I1N8_DAPPU|nr:hypothetical protein DAPPUDRAFT_337458 [Daphnia pulex]|eukprot:EFX62092.1 hypothetical protein DAPPUDRAFT_337458 [Daphnia pulex]
MKMEDVCDLPFNPDEIFTVETLDDTEILIELGLLGQENPDEVLNGDVLLELESFLFDGNSAESTKGDLYQDPPIGQTVPASGLEEMEFEESNLGLNLDLDLQYVPTFSESVDGDEDVFSKYDYRDLVNIQQLDFELFEAQRQKGPTFDDVLVEDAFAQARKLVIQLGFCDEALAIDRENQSQSSIEDLSLMDHKPLPNIPRITNLKLAGQALADILMVYEFLHTFGETLGFDMESLPSLDCLQRALLYDSEAEEELLLVTTHLLVYCVEDPGIAHPNSYTTLLGQMLKQTDITTTNVSEILRIYLEANGLGDLEMPAADKITSSPLKLAAGEYPDTEAFLMSEWLRRKHFLSLNPTQKAAILGFLVNELLQNKAVIGQIEGAIEGQSTARRDRLVVNMKIKKLKTLHSKKHRTSLVSSSFNFSSTAANLADLMDDSTTHDESNHSASGSEEEDEITETEEHPEEADEDSWGEADDNADQGDEDEDEIFLWS